ncbi:MAG: FKBP-type peptidyl-prolyl cis-trans isomerase [Saprospirales bacterium]|nr:FKBP-type peptidyl-prolyl cis-trans isomerase [Saprospirales bacterium]
MIVEEQHVITLSYELRDTDGKGDLLERTDAENPFTFLYGAGQLLPSFESKLRGLKVGEPFAFSLTPEDAYGDTNEENIVDIPMENFKIEGEVPENVLVEGNFITLMDNYGQEHLGKVVTYTDEFARIDFNHVMAGKVLHFEGNILQIRKASSEELEHQHHHPQEGEGGFMDHDHDHDHEE